jgi:hypothetical protein
MRWDRLPGIEAGPRRQASAICRRRAILTFFWIVGEREEVLVPFRAGGLRTTVPVATRFRSTWLSSSVRALRARNLFDAYLAHLPAQHHDAILNTVVGVWLPVKVAEAHYDACDKLKLPVQELVAIGSEVSLHAQGIVFATALNLAKGAGVTPWQVLPRLPEVWYRIWIGGGVAVYKLGPKDARLEVGGWTCASTTYCRIAMRGVLQGLTEIFCERAYVREVPALCSKLTLGYRIAWA